MRLVASSQTVGEIALLLALSDKKVSTSRSRILEKPGLKTSADLTHYARVNKLVE